MNNSGTYIERELPEYVFRKKYPYITFADFNDVFSNRIDCYLEAIQTNEDLLKSKNCLVFLLDDEETEQLEKTFAIEDEEIKQVSVYFKKHKVDDIPFYPILPRKIVITNQQHEFCFYADRKFDVVIMASDFNMFDRKLSEECSESVFTMDVYLQFMKQIMRPEFSFPDFAKKIKENYKVTTP